MNVLLARGTAQILLCNVNLCFKTTFTPSDFIHVRQLSKNTVRILVPKFYVEMEGVNSGWWRKRASLELCFSKVGFLWLL
jgi:hypothetical protein